MSSKMACSHSFMHFLSHGPGHNQILTSSKRKKLSTCMPHAAPDTNEHSKTFLSKLKTEVE